MGQPSPPSQQHYAHKLLKGDILEAKLISHTKSAWPQPMKPGREVIEVELSGSAEYLIISMLGSRPRAEAFNRGGYQQDIKKWWPAND